MKLSTPQVLGTAALAAVAAIAVAVVVSTPHPSKVIVVAAPVAATVAPPTSVTTVAPSVTTTAAPVTTTMAAPAPTTTAAPVVRVTAPPVVQYTAPPVTAAPAPSQRQRLADWYNSYGTIFATISADYSVVLDAPSGSYACEQFNHDVNVAMGYPSIGVPSVDNPWRAALTDYNVATGDCIKAFVSNPPTARSYLDDATQAFIQGNGEVQRATDAVNAIKG